MEFLQTFTNILYIKIPVFDPEKLLRQMLPRLQWMFTMTFFFVSCAIMLGAIMIAPSMMAQLHEKKRHREHPLQPRQHCHQQLLRVEHRNLDVQDVRERCRTSMRWRSLRRSKSSLPACGDSFWASPALSSCWPNCSRSSSVSRSGPEALFKLLLRLVQRVAAVHELDEKVLLLLEAVIAQADGVLDDVIRPALVLLSVDVQVRTNPQPHAFPAFHVARR